MFGRLFGKANNGNIGNVLENGGKIIDVRSSAEYAMGHAPGSINIPLDQIQQRVQELLAFESPLVLCCASGARSGQAVRFLENHGAEVYNGGSWKAVSR